MLLSLCWVLLLCVLDPKTVENGTKVVIRNTFGGWRIQFAKTSWVAFPFGFGKGGLFFSCAN